MPLSAPAQPSAAESQALVALAQAGRWAELEARARQGLARHPQALLLHNLLGSALAGLGRHADAVGCAARLSRPKGYA
jgi:hypothetical protein